MLVRASSQGRVPRLAEGRGRSGRHPDADREDRSGSGDARAGRVLAWPGSLRSRRPLLEDLLKNSTDKEIKDKALFALSQQPARRRPAQILRDFAERESEDEELREQAIFWLGQKHSEDNADYLKSLYGRVKKDALKDKIIFSLSQQRDFGNAEWIMNIALDPKESIEMRKQALFWAGQNGGASTDAFAALYDKMTEPEIKEQLIFVLLAAKSRRQGAREAHGHREDRQGQGAAQQGDVLARPVA